MNNNPTGNIYDMPFYNHKTIVTITLLFCCLFVSGCLGDGENTTGSVANESLIERAESFEDLSIFTQYADSVELSSSFEDSKFYTVFAPTDQIFDRLPEGTLDTLSREQLGEVLTYHVADTALFTSEFSPGLELSTLQGEHLFLGVGANSVFVNDAKLLAGNIQANNGVLHAVDKVLFPDKYLDVASLIEKRFVLNTMEVALTEAQYTDSLRVNSPNGFTVFAPSNEAFNNFNPPAVQAALKDTLKYHVLPQKMLASDFQSTQSLETLNGQQLTIQKNGNSITVNDSISVTESDIVGTNGVVHIVDKIIIPPSE